MSTAPPRVSIGLPVFNGEPFVGAAIDSILEQSFTDFELLISDNASTDRTREICESRAGADRRIRYVRLATNAGAAANFERVFAMARAEYFRWAAHDDLIAPEWLAQCVAALDEDPSAVLCQTGVSEIDADGRIIRGLAAELPRVSSPRLAERFADLVLIDHTCVDVFGLMRSEILRQTPRVAAYLASDRVLLAELGMHGRFRRLPDRLFFLREHPLRSIRALPFHQRTVWFNPAAASVRVFPHWRFYTEYFVSVHRVCRRPLDRWRCYGHLCRWPWNNLNWARLIADVLIAAWPAASDRLSRLSRRRQKRIATSVAAP